MSANVIASLPREIDFAAEAQLDGTIQFSRPLCAHPLAPRRIFLTGATGFAGVFILDEILRRTSADVLCLVRAEGEAAAQDRLIEHLESYELWRSELSGRVRAIAGDLEKAQMGLDAESFATIAARTDVIYHCAGWLNMAFPYSRLKPVNVGGTIEVLRLAGSITTKPVHFISRSLRRMGGLV